MPTPRLPPVLLLAALAVRAEFTPVPERPRPRDLLEAAELAEPLNASGWVTYVCRIDRLLGLQDGTQGRFFRVEEPSAWLDGLAVGDWASVTGRVARLEGLPSLQGAATIARAAPVNAAPPPFVSDFHDILSGRYAGCKVRITATVRRVFLEGEGAERRWVVDLSQSSHRVGAWLCDPELHPPPFQAGDLIEVDAVSAPHILDSGRLLDVRLMIPLPARWRMVKAAEADPALIPSARPLDLHQIPPFAEEGSRVRVRGVLTHVIPGTVAWIQQDGYAVELPKPAAHPGLRPGDRVEALGFTMAQPGLVALEDAEIRVVRRGDPPEPTPVGAYPSMGSRWDDHLVKLRGRVVSSAGRAPGGLRLILRDGAVVFPARLPFPSTALPPGLLDPGTELNVTGICEELGPSDGRHWMQDGGGFVLLVRSPADLELVESAPFWTSDLLFKSGATGILLLAASLLWGLGLRIRVRQRTTELAREIQQRRNEELEFSAVLAERKRLAAELHDTLEQSLTGVALQLQAAGLARDGNRGDPLRHLDLARRLLDQSRAEIRRSVWDLRSEALDARELHLAVLGLQRDAGDGPAVTVGIDGRPGPLGDVEANHLLRIIQESIRNAEKNGAAARIHIQLAYADDRVTVSIEDDGSGFDPAAAPGPEAGHFGLQGMRERTARIGGSFSLDSAPGHGTRIQVRVPRAGGSKNPPNGE